MVYLARASLREREVAAGNSAPADAVRDALGKPRAYRAALDERVRQRLVGVRGPGRGGPAVRRRGPAAVATAGPVRLFVWALVEGVVLLTAGRLVGRPRPAADPAAGAGTLRGSRPPSCAFSGERVPFLLAMGLFGGASALLSTSGGRPSSAT